VSEQATPTIEDTIGTIVSAQRDRRGGFRKDVSTFVHSQCWRLFYPGCGARWSQVYCDWFVGWRSQACRIKSDYDNVDSLSHPETGSWCFRLGSGEEFHIAPNPKFTQIRAGTFCCCHLEHHSTLLRDVRTNDPKHGDAHRRSFEWLYAPTRYTCQF
jgi:hypothetical protein